MGRWCLCISVFRLRNCWSDVGDILYWANPRGWWSGSQ